ncbi:tetratricopeptide repeat protein [Striga asiatica]|uniref:Tetratricopeptide repeat protein n=1 Tax=Striga asiatica TaxID=4170 RepID=A0A5A7NYT0_STRAF|nr:tetratricopeptide repeat protein [Striga asiatica]
MNCNLAGPCFIYIVVWHHHRLPDLARPSLPPFTMVQIADDLILTCTSSLLVVRLRNPTRLSCLTLVASSYLRLLYLNFCVLLGYVFATICIRWSSCYRFIHAPLWRHVLLFFSQSKPFYELTIVSLLFLSYVKFLEVPSSYELFHHDLEFPNMISQMSILPVYQQYGSPPESMYSLLLGMWLGQAMIPPHFQDPKHFLLEHYSSDEASLTQFRVDRFNICFNPPRPPLLEANHIILRGPSSSSPIGRCLLPSASAATCSPPMTMGGVLLRALLICLWGGSRRQRIVCISEPPESPPMSPLL